MPHHLQLMGSHYHQCSRSQFYRRPKHTCVFLPVSRKGLSLSSGLRLLLEIMLPLSTKVKHSPFTIFHRQTKPTRHFLVSSAELAVSKGGGHAEPHTVFKTVTCALPLYCIDFASPNSPPVRRWTCFSAGLILHT